MIAPNYDKDDAGGLGGPESIRPRGSRDTRLVLRAIREGWPIAAKYREPLINRQISVAIDPNTPNREATNAFNAIRAANEQNLKILAMLFGESMYSGAMVAQDEIDSIALELFGDDEERAEEFRQLAYERLGAGGGTAGTVLAPGDDVIEMDQSVPAA